MDGEEPAALPAVPTEWQSISLLLSTFWAGDRIYPVLKKAAEQLSTWGIEDKNLCLTRLEYGDLEEFPLTIASNQCYKRGYGKKKKKRCPSNSIFCHPYQWWPYCLQHFLFAPNILSLLPQLSQVGKNGFVTAEHHPTSHRGTRCLMASLWYSKWCFDCTIWRRE